MSDKLKKALFLGYFFLILLDTFWRETAYTIPHYAYNLLVLVLSTAIILRHTSGNAKLYLLPVVGALFGGLLFIAMGLTQYSDEFTGGILFIIGFALFVCGIIGYLLRKVIEDHLFRTKAGLHPTVALVLTFLLFAAYFSWASPSLISFLSLAAFRGMLVLVALLAIYLFVDWLLRRFVRNFQYGYVALGLMIGVILYIKITGPDDTSLANLQSLSIIGLTNNLYLCLLLIADIYQNINQKK